MPPKVLESIFTKTLATDNDITVLLTENATKKLVGFTVAHIYTSQPELACIQFTGIWSERRGQRLVGDLLGVLDEELRRRKVKFVRRQSRINDGYADAIERHYKDRIVEKKDPETGDVDPRRYFKIRL